MVGTAGHHRHRRCPRPRSRCGGRATAGAPGRQPPYVDEQAHLEAEAGGDRRHEVAVAPEQVAGVIEVLSPGDQAQVDADEKEAGQRASADRPYPCRGEKERGNSPLRRRYRLG